MLFRRGWQACRRRYEMLIEFPFDIRATYSELPRRQRRRLHDWKIMNGGARLDIPRVFSGFTTEN